MGMYATTTALATLMIGTNFDTATMALAVKALTHGENEINKYLSKRYDLTVYQTSTAAIPPLMTSWCEEYAEGKMYIWMSRGGKESLARGKDLIESVLKNLLAVSEYKMDLVNTAGSVIEDFSNTAYRVLSNTSGYSNTFGEDDETAWAVDQDKLDDISNDRDS